MGKKLEGFFYLIAAVFVNFGGILLHFLKVFFNLSFLATGFRLVFPKVVGIDDIKDVFADALEKLISLDVNLTGLRTIFQAFVDAYGSIDGAWDQMDLAYRWRSENKCGGPIKWLQYFAIVIFFGFFFVMTISDALYIVVINSHKVEKGKNKILALVIKALINAATTILFYVLQICAFIGLQMSTDGATVNDNSDPFCSDSDRDANLAARWFILITLIIFAFPAALLFGGGFKLIGSVKQDNIIGKLIVIAFICVKHVILLTLGIWDPENLRTYEIKEKAEKYDDDPTDKDSKQEAVIQIVARTRGIFWILFPGTIFLAKVTETMNSSVIFSKHIEYKDGFVKRLLIWILKVIELAVTLAIIFVPGLAATITLFLSVVLQFFVNLFHDCANAIGIMMGPKKVGIV